MTPLIKEIESDDEDSWIYTMEPKKMNTEDSEFERIEREAKMRQVAVEDDDTQVYKKPWVGLTDEELSILGEKFTYPDEGIDEVAFGLEVQRILKDKNT